MEDSQEFYVIDFPQVAADRRNLTINRLVASTFIHHPYIHPGHFIRDLNDHDLRILVDAGEVEHPLFEQVVLLAMMLSVAEGLEITEDQGTYATSALIMALNCESLYRKKMIKFHHNNFSLGADAGKLVIAEKLDGIDYSSLLDDEEE